MRALAHEARSDDVCAMMQTRLAWSLVGGVRIGFRKDQGKIGPRDGFDESQNDFSRHREFSDTRRSGKRTYDQGDETVIVAQQEDEDEGDRKDQCAQPIRLDAFNGCL